MAKQSGIHQLRGKVGEMSYYRQAGVVPGLARRINQSMSGRVKTADEFVNTRLNNAEFKRANSYATISFRSVFPAWRVMFRRFAIAFMTSRFLEAIKNGTGDWGSRIPSTSFGPLVEDVLENYAKLGHYEGQYGVITKSEDEFGIGGVDRAVPIITLSADRSLTPILAAEGINGVRIYSTSVLMSDIGTVITGRTQTRVVQQAYPLSSEDEPVEIQEDYAGTTASDLNMTTAAFNAGLNADNGGFILIFCIVPMRLVNGKWYELQEKATFVAHGTSTATI